jgi:squalene-hopene/tetraprenyl-beta-curcumene cyclase
MGPRELQEALHNTRQTLLQARGPHGHWEGELSASALSTAVAVIALDNFRKASSLALKKPYLLHLEERCANGQAWLALAQNDDGGWGDTPLSLSNISTTTLGWAAFAGVENQYPEVGRRCAAWLDKTLGRLEPKILARAVADRYGKDRTFSVPILTTLALTGRLGPIDQGWRLVPQLPFELAACPHQWFGWLRLPVVSYALPALIALGLVRHRHRPTWNPVTRLLRRLVRGRVLRVLHSIQPSSGGFLEATPLTSFVVLSLTGAGFTDHAVTREGVKFLIHSARSDGSWPIDTNLATWVTTLAVNALATGDTNWEHVPPEERRKILSWILDQQNQGEHPFTHAAPGGWAWTDLPGGVPDADDTPGALLALRHLGAGREIPSAGIAGLVWLLNLQNRDGGMPTFCHGWGTMPFDRSSADLTAHAIRAWLAWLDAVPAPMPQSIHRAIERGLSFLQRTQRSDGAWAPLWFGNQYAPSEENLTYGTSRVLLGLIPLKAPHAAAAVGWLVQAQNADGGWGGMADTHSSVEETALALESLAAAWQADIANDAVSEDRFRRVLQNGLAWLLQKTEGGTRFPPAPIGFYFAKLWYYEKLYPVIFTLAALQRCVRLSDRLWKTTLGDRDQRTISVPLDNMGISIAQEKALAP